MIKISVILPYFNEDNVAEKTLKLLNRQTVKPDEVIFVDSNSSDRTYEIIQNFIHKEDLKNWLIYKTKYETPSEAKNFGIIKSSFEWCAFMDFDLKFSEKWIEKQKLFIESNKNTQISYGIVNLNPSNYFDKLVIAQTYGLNSNNPVIPSSFINKIYFKKNTYFLPLRSLYDKIFIAHSLANNNKYVLINYNVHVEYFDTNYATNFKELFLKIINYSLQTTFYNKNKIPFIYLFILLSIILVILFNFYLIFIIILFLILLRGFIIPIKKNKNFFKQFSIFEIPNLFLIGISIDIFKCMGFIMSFILKLFKKRVRIDKYYK